jgi:hypothetical protein
MKEYGSELLKVNDKLQQFYSEMDVIRYLGNARALRLIL